MKLGLKTYFGFWILIFGFSLVAYAMSEKDIVFPVAELGNCKNKTECKAYCQAKEHIDACIAFAKSHQLISEEAAAKAQQIKGILKDGGPGGCASFEECKAYCESAGHQAECIAFAKSHGLIENQEAEEGQKILDILEKGLKLPGGCTSKESCEAYCREEEHMDECIEFAHRAGFMGDKDYEIVKKTHGKGPGGCRGQECQEYCQVEEHVDECLTFAKEHGFISEKDAQMAQKSHGKGPGGCRGKECEEFCRKPENQDTCIQFAKEHGFISEEEYQRIKEHHGMSQQEGPGGCRGEECRDYCGKPEHKEECVKFAKDHGFIKEGAHSESEFGTSPKSLENPSGEGVGNPHPMQLPPEALACLQDHASPETVEKIKNLTFGQNFSGSASKNGKSADITPNEKKILMECFNASKGQDQNFPGSASRGNHENVGDRKICPQVITPAKNPENGRCMSFSSPCLVPPGWQKVDACQELRSHQEENQNLDEQNQNSDEQIDNGGDNQDGSASSTNEEAESRAHRFAASLLHVLYFLSGRHF